MAAMMPDTMIMRIAKAITPDWDHCSNNTRKNAIITARVMLQTAREPTEKMVDATISPRSAVYDPAATAFRSGWRAMIDAALAEGDG